MSGVTRNQRSIRSAVGGIRTFAWLNKDNALNTASNTSTARTGGPSTKMTANLIGTARRIWIGWKRAPVVTSKSTSAWCNPVHAPERRHRVKHQVHQIHREVERQQSRQERQRDRDGERIE